MRQTRRRFTAEFKAEAVALVNQQHYTLTQSCQALDIGETALGRWLSQYETEAVWGESVVSPQTPADLPIGEYPTGQAEIPAGARGT